MLLVWLYLDHQCTVCKYKMQMELKRCKHFELGGEKKTKGAALQFVSFIWLSIPFDAKSNFSLSSERIVFLCFHHLSRYTTFPFVCINMKHVII
ncbi:hypothetical protein DL96DRAFT_1461824 [Flagelloscypha sp. PMI_526]|nr:hypothetical protein DL96DRAFT_1461824 [Flagelloscypha sp. PMI_526]